MPNYIQMLETALKKAGDEALAFLVHDHQACTISAKGPKEGFVTGLDFKVDESLRTHLLLPLQEQHVGKRIDWTSEDTEYAPPAGQADDPEFSIIVDSIDGTANLAEFLTLLRNKDQKTQTTLTERFNGRHPHITEPSLLQTHGDEFCISVAIMDRNFQHVASGVYDFMNDVMITAHDGIIRFNSESLKSIAAAQSLETAALIGGKELTLLARGLNLGPKNKILLSGSIAYRMAMVAIAKADITVGPKIPTHVWDVAAGAHLCTVSGHVVTDLHGKSIDWSRREMEGIVVAPEGLAAEFSDRVRGKVGIIKIWNTMRSSVSGASAALKSISGFNHE